MKYLMDHGNSTLVSEFVLRPTVVLFVDVDLRRLEGGVSLFDMRVAMGGH